jgi:hypothetical protein
VLLNHGNPPNGRNRSIAFGRAISVRSRTTAVGKRILQIRIAILLQVCDSALWRLAMLLTLGQLYTTKTFVDAKTGKCVSASERWAGLAWYSLVEPAAWALWLFAWQIPPGTVLSRIPCFPMGVPGFMGCAPCGNTQLLARNWFGHSVLTHDRRRPAPLG